MTPEKAEETFGRIVYQSELYELRAKEDANGLNVFAFKREAGITLTPNGFILGSNAMQFNPARRQ